ncbi:hypothetical protein BJ546DRAFT_725179 [Cryomyces antarcticus]
MYIYITHSSSRSLASRPPLPSAGLNLFPELNYTHDRAEIKRRLQQSESPDTRRLPALGPVMLECLNLEYASMTDVVNGIDADYKLQVTRWIVAVEIPWSCIDQGLSVT